MIGQNMSLFNFNFPDTATEGEGTPYEFTITPDIALTADYTVRWEIIFGGQFSANFGDFSALSGEIMFTNGATLGQTIALPIFNDGSRENTKSFSVRLTQIDADDQKVPIGGDHRITLTDDDMGNFAHIELPSSGVDDTLVAGSSYTYSSFTGVGGNDTIIITRFQTGDITIDDVNGRNVIKFDHGVQITAIDEDDIFEVVSAGIRVVNSVIITLATGGKIRIASPDNDATPVSGAVGSKRYSFQIGDGVLTDYAGFYDAITVSGFAPGGEGALNTPVDVDYPAAGDGTADASLFTASLADTATEDTPYEFTITPDIALTADYTVRWEIIFGGQFSANFGDFSALSGEIMFTNGATLGQTIALPIFNDGSRENTKSFSVRLTQIDADDQKVPIGGDHRITLTDDDMGNFAHIELPSSGVDDTLVAGSSYTYSSFTGVGGNDTIIITRFQTGDITIDDVNGRNVIKFDHGVQITAIDEDDIFEVVSAGIRVVNSVIITLATGGKIRIASPDNDATPVSGAVGSKRYSFQIGDGVLTDYAGFYDAITVSGFAPGGEGALNTPVDVAFPVAAVPQPAALEITATLDDIIKDIIVGNTDVATLTVSGTANIADFTFTTNDDRFIINGNIVQLLAGDYTAAPDESFTVMLTGLDDKGTAGDTSDDVTITQSFTFSFLNDDNPAVISGDAKGEFDVSAQTVSGDITITDVDATPSITISNGGVGLYGTLSIDAVSGEWTYTINPSATAVASLADYATLDESFTVTAGDDSNTHTIAINIDKLALPTKGQYYKWTESGATLLEESSETSIFSITNSAQFLLFDAGTTPDDTSDDHVIRDTNREFVSGEGQGYGPLDGSQFVFLDDSLPISIDGRPLDLRLTGGGNDVFVLEAGITRDIQISEDTNGGYNIIKLGNDMTVVNAKVQNDPLFPGSKHVITIDTDTTNSIATDTIEILFTRGVDNTYVYDENIFDSVNSLLTDFA